MQLLNMFRDFQEIHPTMFRLTQCTFPFNYHVKVLHMLKTICNLIEHEKLVRMYTTVYRAWLPFFYFLTTRGPYQYQEIYVAGSHLKDIRATAFSQESGVVH
jgi:hypothetical protein